MKRYLILIMSICTTFISYSQRCGGGTFIFEFYVLNEKKIENLRYEILNFDSESLKAFDDIAKINQPKYASFVRDYEGGIILNSNMIIENDKRNEDLIRYLTKRKIDKKGIIYNGLIKFQTSENYNKPYILKIINNQITFYILANLFGGCDRTTKILLQDIPRIVIEK